MKKILLFFVLLFSGINSAFAWEYTWKIEDGGNRVAISAINIFDSESNVNVVIPGEVTHKGTGKKYKITSINSGAFRDCENKLKIISVKLPENGEFCYINNEAFKGCTNLQSINIPSTVKGLTDDNDKGLRRNAFDGCTNLKTVTINSETLMTSTNNSKGVGDVFKYATTINMGDDVRKIGSYAFYRSNKDLALTTFDFNNVTSIGSNAFENANKLTNVNLKNVETIGSDAFKGCTFTNVHFSKLTSDAGLPSSVKTYYIDELGTKTTTSYSTTEDILRNCESSFTVTNTNVTKLVFGNNVHYIYMGILGSSATNHAKLKISEIECKYDGVGLGYLAFDGLTSLTKFTGKPGYIHDGVFRNCSNLTSVDLSLCTDINQYGFQKCSNLTTVTSLGNLTYIGKEAFSGCTNLAGVIENSNNLTIGQSAFNNCANITGLTAPLADIRTSAFNGCTSLAQATVGKLLNNGSCFSGCTSLKTLTFGGDNNLSSDGNNVGTAIGVAVDNIKFGDNITVIYSGAFSGYGVKTVDLNKVTNVGSNAFYQCSSLTTVSNSSNVRSIGFSAFSQTGVTECSFSEITSFGANAFDGCNKLVTIRLGETKTISNSAFENCTNLTYVYALDATTIGNCAFKGCVKLRDDVSYFTTQNNVTIGNEAFSGCKALQYSPITHAKAVGEKAFYDCTNLVWGRVYDAETIGASAFENCTNLSIASMSKVVRIEKDAFKNTSITSVDLPNTLAYLGTGAFPSVYEVKLNCPILLEKNYTESDNLLHRFGIVNAGGTGYIEIGDDVTKIGKYAFYNNTYSASGAMDVEHIRIGDGVTTLNTGAFYGLNATNYIYIGKALPMDEAYYKTDHQLLMTCENKVTMMHPAKSYDVYLKKDQNWHTIFGKKVKEYELGVGYATGYILPKYALYTESETALQRITFNINPVEGNPQIAVLDDAVSGNENLESIDLSNTIIIGERSFKGCTKLKSVTIGTDEKDKGANSTNIQANAFNGCTALSTIEIRAVNASVDATAFTGVKPFIMIDMSDQATLPSVNGGETIFITNKEARAKELREEKIGGVKKYKYVTSVQRMGCEPTDVDMNGTTDGRDAQAIYDR